MGIKDGFGLGLLLFLAQAHAQEKPPLPFTERDSCPFECCAYGDWQAIESVDAHLVASTESPVTFRVSSGRAVRALTGVTITTQFGMTKILKPIKIGYRRGGKAPELSLLPGDVVYTLHYAGEANDSFWYQGKIYTDEINMPESSFGAPANESAVQVISRPKYEWWIKIRGAGGSVGWVKGADSFAGSDSCG